MKTTVASPDMNVWNKFLLRFILLYFIFYIYPYGLEYIHNFKFDDFSFWKGITIWFGETFFGWEFNRNLLYNGFDSKYDFSRFSLIAVLSILFSCIWIFLDRKFKWYYDVKVKQLLRTILRYHVGLTLALYGLAKLIPTQFGVMSFDRLETPLGDFTGMGLLWAFMGYSKFYTIVTGWVEFIGGVLLLFRRTTFLGSFILLIAMLNVVIIDIGYDVTVKMFAVHLLCMVIVLLGPYAKNLLNFFVFNLPTTSIKEKSLFDKNKKIANYIKAGILILFSISLYHHKEEALEYAKEDTTPTISGEYEVIEQVRKNDTLKIENDGRWKSFSINGSSWKRGSFRLEKMDGENYYYDFKADTVTKTIELISKKDTVNSPYKFRYSKIGKEVVFEGKYKGDSIMVKTKSKTLLDYRLMRKTKLIRDLED